MTARTVERAGVRLHVVDDGPHDGPAVLLLHGFPDTSDIWAAQRAALTAAGHRVIVPDQRGFGASGKRPTCPRTRSPN